MDTITRYQYHNPEHTLPHYLLLWCLDFDLILTLVIHLIKLFFQETLKFTWSTGLLEMNKLRKTP